MKPNALFVFWLFAPHPQALRFGEACGRVENRAHVGAQGAAGLLATLEAHIEALEATILAKERWETVEVRARSARLLGY